MPSETAFFRCARTLVLSVHLVILPAMAGIASADGDSATLPAPGTGYAAAFGKSMDDAHSSLEHNILEQTIHLDNFFGDVRTDNQRQTGYELRWRNSFRIEDGGSLHYGASVRANFVLSRISERLHLDVAGEDEPRPFTQSLPKDPGNPGFDRTTPVAHFANTELRYELIRASDMNLFLGAGVRLDLPFEAFVRSRFQLNHHISSVSLLKFRETFFLKNTDLLGETTEIGLERLFDKGAIIRWTSAGTASQEIRGLEWGSELSVIKELLPGSAVTLTGGVYGNTNSSPVAQNYRFLARYRSGFLRKWLFYELEPEISWPRDNNGNYPATLAFTFRIEIVFKGQTATTDHKPEHL